MISYKCCLKKIWDINFSEISISSVLNDLNRLRATDFISRNEKEQVLEQGLLVASFIPFAWDCIDIWYGSYKYINWADISWNNVNNYDAAIQASFWVIWLWLNIYTWVWWSLLKAFLKSQESWVVNILKNKIPSIIEPLIPKISAIFNSWENIMSSIWKIKEIITKEVLPQIKDDLLLLSKELQYIQK